MIGQLSGYMLIPVSVRIITGHKVDISLDQDRTASPLGGDHSWTEWIRMMAVTGRGHRKTW